MIKLLILNLLDIQPMSVYDIKSALEQFDAVRWANILIGSIQNAVNSLFKSGAIEIESVQSVGKRKKTIYRITEYGYEIREKETKKSLESGEISFSYDFFIGLSSLSIFHDKEKRNMLIKRKDKLIQVKESIEKGVSIKEKHTDLENVQYLVIENMISTVDIQIKLIDEIIKNLEV
ncbi:MAG: helix-turn-helix transcriptional regulator [Thermotaleaceae bacterium]